MRKMAETPLVAGRFLEQIQADQRRTAAIWATVKSAVEASSLHEIGLGDAVGWSLSAAGTVCRRENTITPVSPSAIENRPEPAEAVEPNAKRRIRRPAARLTALAAIAHAFESGRDWRVVHQAIAESSEIVRKTAAMTQRLAV
jgi:hypothetical protein